MLLLMKYTFPLFLFFFALGDVLAESRAPNVTMSASSDVLAVSQGDSFSILVRFELQDGWHIYWKNPGDSGLPTKISAQAVDGFTFGEAQYPTPERFVQGGGLVGYGYAKEVVFILPVQFIGSAKQQGGTAELVVKGNWLNCSKTMCVPAKGEVKIALELGVSKKNPEAQNALFAAQAALPTLASPEELVLKHEQGAFLVQMAAKEENAHFECYPGIGVKLLGISQGIFRFSLAQDAKGKESEVLCRLNVTPEGGRRLVLHTTP